MDVRPYLEISCRLFIKALPVQFSPEDTIDFLRTFGAIHVELMSPFGKMKHTAFANFINRSEAKRAMHRLHQLEVLGARLIVLWATAKLEKESNSSVFNSSRVTSENAPPDIPRHFPIPNSGILAQISKCLAVNNEFYTEVLHLMEKMQLPFLPEKIHSPVPVESQAQIQSGDESDESLAPLRARYSPVRHAALSIPGLLAKHTESIAVESSVLTKRRRIEFNLATEQDLPKTTPPLYSTFDTPLPIGTLSKHHVSPERIKSPSPVPSLQLDSYISDFELRHGRLSKSEMRRNALFKSYSRGDASSRLYLKNLAKSVTERDINFIFGRYVDFSRDEDKRSYLITLMRGGRMRGQAFVGLPSPEVALRALEDTNGCILHGKPIVVTFARSAIAKK